MRKSVRAGGVAVALLAMTAQAFAGCTKADDGMAMRVAALQQELMVAALTCRAIPRYNEFVTSYRRELRASDDALKAHFEHARAGGIADYHAFKTRLANQDSIRSIHDANYCYEADAAFQTAQGSRSLATVVTSTPVMMADDVSAGCASSGEQAFSMPSRQDRIAVQDSGRDGDAPRDHVFAPDTADR
ncbi:MAG TPA: hypothetical protein VGM17_18280 [Rhizomicrobium sp.]|jgi:hypothetical protein